VVPPPFAAPLGTIAPTLVTIVIAISATVTTPLGPVATALVAVVVPVSTSLVAVIAILAATISGPILPRFVAAATAFPIALVTLVPAMPLAISVVDIDPRARIVEIVIPPEIGIAVSPYGVRIIIGVVIAVIIRVIAFGPVIHAPAHRQRSNTKHS
jgi:hypothetical protein